MYCFYRSCFSGTEKQPEKGSAFGRRCFGGVCSFTEWLKHCPEAGEHECDGKPDRADSAACADVELQPGAVLEEDQETLFEILPEESLQLYQPKLSELVKAGFVTENFKKDPAKYAKLWTRIGIKAPATYLNAWLLTSYGFWYPGADIDVYNGTRCYESSSYFSCETEGPGRRDSKLPWLEHWYENLSWTDTVHKIPVVSLPFSPGALCWCYVLGTLFLIASGNWRKAAVFSPVCLNLLTVLLGPTYLVRYVLIFWFALPLYLSICVGVCYTSKDNGKSGKSCVKADKQAAGNLPDGSLFGKAFHESKD